LLGSGDEALVFFARRDLLGEEPGSIQRLWTLPGALRILKRQLPNGSWPRPVVHKHPAINAGLIETWRQIRFLVEKFGLTRQHPRRKKAAVFIFSCQSEGRLAVSLPTSRLIIRVPSGLLIRLATRTTRIEKASWLLSMRQNDGAALSPGTSIRPGISTARPPNLPRQSSQTARNRFHITGRAWSARLRRHPVYRTSGQPDSRPSAEIQVLSWTPTLLPVGDLLGAV
jgi:hypothetical protein